MLPVSELAQLRRDIRDLMPDYCSIQSVTRTADGYGGWAETWTEVEQSRCRMDHKTGREILAGGKVQSYQGNTLTLPYDAQITAGDRVLYAGVYYLVVSVSEGSGITVRRATVERIGATPATVPDWYGLAFDIVQNSVYAGLI